MLQCQRREPGDREKGYLDQPGHGDPPHHLHATQHLQHYRLLFLHRAYRQDQRNPWSTSDTFCNHVSISYL